MRTFNFLMSLLFFLAGLPGLLFSIYTAVVPVDHFVKIDNDNYAAIQAADEYVSSFKSKYSRAPSRNDFSLWVGGRSYTGRGDLDYYNEEFSEELIAVYGPPPEDGYVLSILAGSVQASYPSWSKSDKHAYIFESNLWSNGSRWADVVSDAWWWILMFTMAAISSMGWRDEDEVKTQKKV